MAKVKAKDRYVFLICSEQVDREGGKIATGCQRRNYYIHKSRGKKVGAKPEPLVLMKYCRWCRQHTRHKEVK